MLELPRVPRPYPLQDNLTSARALLSNDPKSPPGAIVFLLSAWHIIYLTAVQDVSLRGIQVDTHTVNSIAPLRATGAFHNVAC